MKFWDIVKWEKYENVQDLMLLFLYDLRKIIILSVA